MTRIGTSIVIPARDEESALPALLSDLQPLRALGEEIIVVDGGSRDGTVRVATPLADRVITSEAGRATQMNAGATVARGDTLMFLHADTRLPAPVMAELARLRAEDGWGFFAIALEGESRWLPVVSFCMNLRSRLTGIATGDQGLFVSRALFTAVGGFPEQPLMEDVEICARLRRLAPPTVSGAALRGSGRRWDRHGAIRTILLMWALRLRYSLGADPARLHARYYG